jgi:hypothetical protein
MEKSVAALRCSTPRCNIVPTNALTIDERIFILEEQMRHMRRVFVEFGLGDVFEPRKIALNKDGIPVGTRCYGKSTESPFLIHLTVEPDHYIIGNNRYQSLSTAASAVDSTDTDGWSFWKPVDGKGKSLMEVYRG